MPITKDGNGVINETAFTDKDEFDKTGVVRSDIFAVRDAGDQLKQIAFDCSGITTNTTVTVSAPSGSSGTFSLPATAGGALRLSAETLQYSAPVAAATVTVAAATTALVMEPAGTLATLTVALPAGTEGKQVKIASTQEISALTLTANGGDTIVHAPTTMLIDTVFALIFRASTSKWYKIA